MNRFNKLGCAIVKVELVEFNNCQNCNDYMYFEGTFLVWPQTILCVGWSLGGSLGFNTNFKTSKQSFVSYLADHRTTVQSQLVYSTCVHTTGYTTQSEIEQKIGMSVDIVGGSYTHFNTSK